MLKYREGEGEWERECVKGEEEWIRHVLKVCLEREGTTEIKEIQE